MSQGDIPSRWSDYLALADDRPELFKSPADGGIKILWDPRDVQAVEQNMARSLQARGLPESGAQVGVVARDPYFYVVRDAVEFPDGARRTYTRVIHAGNGGAAVLPVLDGRIVLIRLFRHAPRAWTWEIPRGGIEPDQTPEDAARAEVHEEIGGDIADLVSLGPFLALSNLQSNHAHLFWARLSRIGRPQQEEAIASIDLLTAPEFEARLLGGEILDSFTIAAFTHARLRGLV